MSALAKMLEKQESGGAGASAPRGKWSSNRNRTSSGDYNNGGSSSRNPSSGSRWGSSNNRSDNTKANNDGWQNVEKPRHNRHNNNNNNNNNNRRSNNKGFSQADHTYTNLRQEIQRRAREKQSTFSAEGNTVEKAFQQELLKLQSWVGELQDKSEADPEQQCIYFQDRTKKYPFYTGKDGHDLLQVLLESNASLLKINIELCMGVTDVEPSFIMAEGELIYEVKPTLKAYNKTWSQEEYGHPGLQRTYIKLKSFQRFTETWATLERSAANGLFDVHRPDWQPKHALDEGHGPGPIRIASIGGGPGYELLATRIFFDRFAPGTQLELVSLDLCPSWRQYVEGLGFTFYHWNIHDGKHSVGLNT